MIFNNSIPHLHKKLYTLLVKTFASLKKEYPQLVAMSLPQLEKFDRDASTNRGIINTRTHIYTTIIALIIIGYLPYAIYQSITITIGWQQGLAKFLTQRDLLDSHPELVISFILLLISLPFYTILWIPPNQLLKSFENLLKKLTKHFQFVIFPFRFIYKITKRKTAYVFIIIKKRRSFIIYSILCLYIFILLLQVLLYSFQIFPLWLLKPFTIFTLVLPLLLLSFVPIVVIIFLLAFIEYSRDYRAPLYPLADIITKLITLLSYMKKNKNKFLLDPLIRANIITRIYGISDLFKAISYKNLPSHPLSEWGQNQLKAAANEFVSLSKEAHLPDSDSFIVLESGIINYINIFLTGDLKHLPRNDEAPATIKKRKKHFDWVSNLFVLLLALIFLFLPIGLFQLLINYFHVNLSPLLQSPLTILYVIWSLISLIYFLEKLTPDLREVLYEILKQLFRKG